MKGVKRVWGTADNISLIFQPNEQTGRWEAKVPTDQDGQYVVALYAEDFAGNVAYMATILFIVQLRGLRVDFRLLEVNTHFSFSDVQTFLSTFQNT